ncbi:MAG: penicillin-binding transpeptidase domain-containing protein [Candidatus Zambryskibacteria bacterium]|nr:penicillin-binding transpeptidase domain-containing protein [Candidatus Zambryskibacteria bacterium]
MFHQIKNFFIKRDYRSNRDIDPDEIFLDSKNLPDFDTYQFEGRIEKPISHSVFGIMMFFIICVGVVFVYKVWDLQIIEGQTFRIRSDNNSLHKTLVFADRGVIYDRNKVPLVWNDINPETTDFSLRVYATSTGLSTILGYIKYPTKDSSGFYYQDSYDPKDGIEKIYNDQIAGENGIKIIETDVKGNIISESIIEPPVDGGNIDLSIDVNLQKKLNNSLLDIANRAGYKGGAGVLMDIHTGEIIASSNFPEYESGVMTKGYDSTKINEWIASSNYPFLNRVVSGLYTPGSIMKIFIAIGVLTEGVISPTKQILSTGSISIPNPFFPDKPSIFLDWKAHGLVDLRHAIAVSSNVYFYEVTGGYQTQKGIGITNIEKYTRMFGFGTTTGVYFPGENSGTIPSPEWKSENFNGEAWRVGDTYNTAIGQYGFQVTPLQVVRAVSAIANEGALLTPTFLKVDGMNNKIKISGNINLDQNFYTIVKEGMRLCVTVGTCQPLNLPFIEIASKTGTAQIGVNKDEVNSWVIGFWPYKNPKYAFAVVMERGSRSNQFSATLVMQEFFNWMNIYASEYLK